MLLQFFIVVVLVLFYQILCLVFIIDNLPVTVGVVVEHVAVTEGDDITLDCSMEYAIIWQWEKRGDNMVTVPIDGGYYRHYVHPQLLGLP